MHTDMFLAPMSGVQIMLALLDVCTLCYIKSPQYLHCKGAMAGAKQLHFRKVSRLL